MTRFDERDAHTLVCLQSNRGIPMHTQECVCRPHLPRTFETDFGVDGPYAGNPYCAVHRIACWVLGIAGFTAVCFIAGALLRHFNLI